jgi:hypothetical protein
MPAGLEDQIIESAADEDIDTDDEILYAGRRTCHQDLLPLVRRIEMPNYVFTIKNTNIKNKISFNEQRSNPNPTTHQGNPFGKPLFFGQNVAAPSVYSFGQPNPFLINQSANQFPHSTQFGNGNPFLRAA